MVLTYKEFRSLLLMTHKFYVFPGGLWQWLYWASYSCFVWYYCLGWHVIHDVLLSREYSQLINISQLSEIHKTYIRFYHS